MLWAAEGAVKYFSLKALRAEELVNKPPEMLKVEKIEFWYYVIYSVTVIFILQMDLFLIFLITRFTREKQIEKVQDTVLGRDVPRIVFVNNQKMLKDAYL